MRIWLPTPLLPVCCRRLSMSTGRLAGTEDKVKTLTCSAYDNRKREYSN